MSRKINILLLEDSALDAELVETELRRARVLCSCRRVQTPGDFADALRESPPDLVLADYSLPQFSGLEALTILRNTNPDVPFISISGCIGEEGAVELMKRGITDFVSKERLGRLGPAIQRALREVERQREERHAVLGLRDGELRFRAVFERAGTGIALEDLHGAILETNPALQQLLGYTAGELRELTRRDFTHSQDQEEDTAQFTKLLAGEMRFYEAEKRFVRKDGRIIYGKLTVSLERDTDGQPRCPVVMIQDTTERQRAVEAQMQYAAIVEFSNDAIVGTAMDGFIFSWNPAAERLYGHSASEANGRPISLIIPPDREREFNHILERIKHGERIDNFETTRRRKNGSIVHVSVTISPINDNSGAIIGASSIARDITGRKQAEAALRESEENYRKLVELSPDAIFIVREGEYIYLNSSALKLLGAGRAEEVVGRRVAEFIHPDYHELAAERTRQLMAGQPAVPLLEVQLVRLDGATVVVEETAIPFVYRGKPAAQVVARDITERKRAEEAVRKSEASLARAQRTAGLGSWEFDFKTGELTWSAETYRIFGLTREQFGGTSEAFFEWVHPDDREAVRQAGNEALSPGRPLKVDHRIILPGGEVRLVSEQGEVVFDAYGNPERIVGTVLDITDRKRAENRGSAFSELAQRLSSAATAPDAAAIIADVADKLLGWDACNLALCAPDLETFLTIYNMDLVDGRRCSIPPTSVNAKPSPRMRHVFERGAQLTLRKASEFSGPAGYPFGNASRPSASIMYVPVRNGPRIIGVFSIHSYSFNAYTEDDLNLLLALGDHCGGALERIRAQAENHKLAAFAQLNPNPVLELSSSGAINYFNDATRQMAVALGYQHPSEFLPPETAGWVGNCLATGESKLRQLGVISGRTISWSFFPIKAIGVVHCYAVDITDRQDLEARLRQAQKMESVGQLAGGVAHDFNNILTVIQGHTSLLMLTPGLPDQAFDSARQINQSAERAANLTRQLLTFSRRQIMQPKNLDLNEVVNNLTKMLRRLLGEHMTLQVHYGSNLPRVHADPGMMDQILMNLVVNSRDAMPRGGRLFINTSVVTVDDASAGRIPGASAGEYVCLAVKDTGSGIAPEHLPHIFEPFFTTKDVGKGTGLGLATVYGIVQQHRGWVRVASKVNEETTFEVFLPAVRERAPAWEPAPVVESKVPGGTETILVVEDETPLRSLVRSILQRHGYRVLEANSGVEALPVWTEHRDNIHLLLTDMVMPHGMSGRELAERLTGERPDLKVIYSSGYSLAVVGSDMVLREGVNFLQKPYHPRRLAQAVRDCLDA